MIIPIEIRASRRFKFFWMKSVTGFNRRVHCARCLVGRYHPDLSPLGLRAGDVLRVALDVSSAPVHYICGVSGKWVNNLHIAFEADPGAPPLTIEGWGIAVTFPEGGVRRIAIMPPVADVDPAFGTCRNWLFGLQYFEGYPPRAIAARSAATASTPRP